MARGHKNRGRGGFRGGFDDNAGFRGRGRGNFRGGRGGGRGRGRGGPVYFDEFDLPIQQWPSNQPPATPPPRGYGPPRGRGRGRGFFPAPFNVYTNPRRGVDSPRGRGQSTDNFIDSYSATRGRGRNLGTKLNAGAPLSKLLYEDRPYLRPVKFVRSVHTATLFENEEDIFQSVIETAVGDEESHIPTADAVFRVFHPLDKQVEGAEVEDGDDEQLEEIDFADIARIQAEVDAAAARQGAVVSEVTIAKEEIASFFVDTTPAEVDRSRSTAPIQVNRMEGALGDTNVDDDDEEEIIVYVAPHPRNGKSHTLPQATITPSQIPSTSILTGRRVDIVGNQPMAVDDLFQSKVPDTQPAFKLEMGTLFPESPHTAPEPDQLPPPSFRQMANIEAPRIELAASPPVETSANPIEPSAVDYPAAPAVENSAAPAAQPPATPNAIPTIDSVSFSFAQTSVKRQTRRLHPVGTPRALLKRNRKARRKSLRGFGAFGAMHEEAMLREVDPRRHEQRRGDSDVDWGTSDGEDGVDALSVDMGGMELDEGISFDAMKSFVKSMSAEGSRHVTMDDIADIEQHRKEDEEADIRGSDSEDDSEGGTEGDEKVHAAANNATKEHSGDDDHEEESEEDAEVEAIVRAEEGLLVGDSDGLDEDDDEDDSEGSDSEDQDETPRRGFQARLERLRNQSSKGKGKGKAKAGDDSSDEAMSVQMTWADEDEDYLEHIQEVLDANQDLLGTGSRRARKYMTKAILNGDFDRDEYSEMMQPAKRGKDKYVAPELSDQWEKDRQKKAENKKKRALERMILAADPLAQHKGGKKGRKAMLAAARAADDLPNRIVDLVTLEQQIRRFMADIGGTNTMVLPPADKETRKRVHELATAFNLKSQSKGSGESRYTTLIKTSKSGININEGKIRRIMRQATNGQWEGPSRGGGRGGKDNLAKHREGEEVGKDAAKIDEKNVGFRMLAAMGWTDGDRIGLSGGLDVPLTAIMKKTKAGLGATPAMFS